ncbi:MAG: cytochrome C oxidase subunit IV family protein [Acidobacteria bacterium]|nr:cytochrome C oxidase subunit IV family protein [Acidobacteriota bacterium]
MSHSAEHHVTGPKTYAAVLGGLLLLTIITVYASYLDFGSMNTVVALLIASMKGALVALFFMHLRHDKFNAVIFLMGLLFLAIFLIWTLFDINTRVTVLPTNLKAPVQAFPGAPLNKPVRPSTGQPVGTPHAQ